MEDQAQLGPAAPEIQDRIRASFERQGLMRHLGARLGDIVPGRVQIVSRPEVTQQDDYIHAGATSAIADYPPASAVDPAARHVSLQPDRPPNIDVVTSRRATLRSRPEGAPSGSINHWVITPLKMA